MARARLPLGLIAAAAMLGSHWLAYLIAAPEGHSRAHLLAATGHGYWGTASVFAVVALVGGLVAFVTRRMRERVSPSDVALFRYALPRFAVLQLGGFAVLELVEWMASGHAVGFSTLLEGPIVVGLVVQALVALVCALSIVAVAAVVDRLAPAALPSGGSAEPVLHLASLIPAPRPAPARGSWSLRGPPALV